MLFLLLGQGSFDNVDATATVKEEATLTITVRKRVQNITVSSFLLLLYVVLFVLTIHPATLGHTVSGI